MGGLESATRKSSTSGPVMGFWLSHKDSSLETAFQAHKLEEKAATLNVVILSAVFVNLLIVFESGSSGIFGLGLCLVQLFCFATTKVSPEISPRKPEGSPRRPARTPWGTARGRQLLDFLVVLTLGDSPLLKAAATNYYCCLAVCCAYLSSNGATLFLLSFLIAIGGPIGMVQFRYALPANTLAILVMVVSDFTIVLSPRGLLALFFCVVGCCSCRTLEKAERTHRYHMAVTTKALNAANERIFELLTNAGGAMSFTILDALTKCGSCGDPSVAKDFARLNRQTDERVGKAPSPVNSSPTLYQWNRPELAHLPAKFNSV